MISMRTVAKRASSALPLLGFLAAQLHAQGDARFAARGARTSDAVVARDLARFDSVSSATPNARLAAYAMLARDAYERNDDGALTARLLDVAEGKRTSKDIRARRSDLWNALDGVFMRTDLTPVERDSAVALEVALVRAGSTLLGAPSCAKWEAEAERLATMLRRPPVTAPRVDPAPQPVPPSPAPPTSAPAPAPTPRPSAPATLRAVPSDVHFALDKSLLAPGSKRVLDAVIDSLAYYPGVTVVLEGHTDVRGSVVYNEALSKRRVNAVRDYLVSKGLAASRVSTKAMGKSKLDTDRTGNRDHAINRRVVLRYFTADGKEIPTLNQLDDLQLEKR